MEVLVNKSTTNPYFARLYLAVQGNPLSSHLIDAASVLGITLVHINTLPVFILVAVRTLARSRNRVQEERDQTITDVAAWVDMMPLASDHCRWPWKRYGLRTSIIIL